MVIFFEIPIVVIAIIIFIAVAGVKFGLSDLALLLMSHPLKLLIPVFIICVIVAAIAVFFMYEDNGLKNTISFAFDASVVVSYVTYYAVLCIATTVGDQDLFKTLMVGVFELLKLGFFILLFSIPLLISAAMTLGDDRSYIHMISHLIILAVAALAIVPAITGHSRFYFLG